MTKDKVDTSLPFALQVVSNPKINLAQEKGEQGVFIGTQAMIAAGAQSEFVTANILQAQALNCSIILRAGDPPQYNKERSPKSGVNLSKTSKQGFFKGSLSEELRFARIENGEPKPHHEKDDAHLLLKPTDPEYQHRMQLDINMQDILRELGPDGDLQVLGFDSETGLLRFEYKEGHGPKKEDHGPNIDAKPPKSFNGQFVINIKAAENNPLFYSREWDKVENDPNWDPEQGVIKKPAALAALPDDKYKELFSSTFKLQYTESKQVNPTTAELKSANVFANRARSAEEFKQDMGSGHPHYLLIKDCGSLNEILHTLKTNLSEEEANKTILDTYNKGGKIVAGDWDGMALGHPPDLNPQYAKVIDVFAAKEEGIENKAKLLDLSDAYLKEIQDKANKKIEENIPLSLFEEKALSISKISAIVSDFALARAGCITAHEFVYQQVLNHAYRDQLNSHYGEKYNTTATQAAMEKLVAQKNSVTPDTIISVAKNLIQEELKLLGDKISKVMLHKVATHMAEHFILATKNTEGTYQLPHLQHDVNVHDLYQHGFDMRNPYGCNLEGAWFLISSDGSTLYGETQEELVEVMLTGDFLEKNHIEVNHGANMEAGWGKIITRQIELEQTIPAQTLEKYKAFQKADRVEQFHNLKSQFAQVKTARTEATPKEQVELKTSPEAPETESPKSRFAMIKQEHAGLRELLKPSEAIEEKVDLEPFQTFTR